MDQTGNNPDTGVETAGTQLESGPGHPLYQLIPGPWSYLDMKQGLDDDQMIGSSVFSKYLTQKIRMKFPAGNSARGVNGSPLTWFLIHGFVTVPIMLNEFTTTHVGGATRSFLNAHVDTYLKPYFDKRADMLSFDNQRSKTIKIIRKIKLKRNRNADMNIPASGTCCHVWVSPDQDPRIYIPLVVGRQIEKFITSRVHPQVMRRILNSDIPTDGYPSPVSTHPLWHKPVEILDLYIGKIIVIGSQILN